jgi:hypothetical protein
MKTQQIQETKNVEVKDFSKDHWSLLGYIESRVNSNQVAPFTGELDRRHIRINENTHSHLCGGHLPREISSWQESWGTRLKGFWTEKGTDESRRLSQHDDFDCLEDLEAAGIIKIMSTVNMFIMLTEYGVKVASKLREHKMAGNNFADFELK